jgi:GDPmannose 4,6-dehydratase
MAGRRAGKEDFERFTGEKQMTAADQNAKKALVFGITGQDGSYLAEFLLDKGYEVHGVVRRASTFNTARIDHLYRDPHVNGVSMHLHYGDLSDANTIRKLIYQVRPDEIYNLGAQSHVRVSFDIPEYTANITGLGALRILEAIKDFEEHAGKKVKFYQASSSEMFGSAPPPQNEKTPFHPRSPYGCAKVFAFYTTVNYREAYNIFAVNGILFNHEGPRRGETFVTRKITRGIARILAGLDKKIYLGNLEAKRDWGYAPEYMEAAYLMMQQKEPDDYVIGTGESHSVREFVEAAFREAGIPEWERYVEIDPRYYRPAEVENLVADPRKAKEKLGWEAKTKFADLVKIMVDAELKAHGLKK